MQKDIRVRTEQKKVSSKMIVDVLNFSLGEGEGISTVEITAAYGNLGCTTDYG